MKKQKLTKPSTLFGAKPDSGVPKESIPPLPAASPLSKLSANIYNTKLSDFIDAVIDGDRTVLDDDNYQQVLEQYNDELITPKDRYKLGLILEIKNYQYKTTYVKAALTYLQHDVNEQIIKGLMTIGATETPMPADPAKMDAWFKRLTGRLKKWAGLVQAREEELKSFKSDDKDQALTRASFDEMIIELSSMLKYQVNEKDISVNKYIVMIKRYRKAVEKQKK